MYLRDASLTISRCYCTQQMVKCIFSIISIVKSMEIKTIENYEANCTKKFHEKNSNNNNNNISRLFPCSALQFNLIYLNHINL